MRLLIIRHGDPDYANDTLTKKGHKEAALLAQKLCKEKIDYLYSSPLGRAKHTCDYTARALGKENGIVIKDWLAESLTLPCSCRQDKARTRGTGNRTTGCIMKTCIIIRTGTSRIFISRRRWRAAFAT